MQRFVEANVNESAKIKNDILEFELINETKIYLTQQRLKVL